MAEVAEIQGEVVTPAAKPRRRNGDGRAVVKAEAGAAPAPVPQGDAFLAMIERAARDPSVDIDKMERLFAMHERMAAQQAKTAYLAALASMQPNLPVIGKHGIINKNEKDDRGNKTGNQVAMTKYAKWEDVIEGIAPVLAEHGFSLSFRTAQPTPDRIVVAGVLGHREGHSEETSISLPIDSTGAKNNVQGWGSSVSYGKRYTAFALLNISARGEDDDGKIAGAEATITDAQCSAILDKIAETEANIQKFCGYFHVDGVAKLPAKEFERAMTLLNQRGRK
jgi:hypothetical protein